VLAVLAVLEIDVEHYRPPFDSCFGDLLFYTKSPLCLKSGLGVCEPEKKGFKRHQPPTRSSERSQNAKNGGELWVD
jgi:hypothetical protein